MGTVAGAAAIAGVAASVIGTGVSVYGSMQQASAKADAANYQAQVAKNNATVAAQNAAAARDQAEAKAAATTRAGALRLGAQRAALAASGVTLDSGSALDVQSATAQGTAQGAANDQYDGLRQAYGFETQGANFNAQAGLSEMTAANDESAGYVAAAGTLLSGASQVSSKWAKWQNPTGDGAGGGSAGWPTGGGWGT